MTLEEIVSKHSLKAIGRSIGLDVQMVDGYLQCMPLDPDDPRYSLDFVLPSMKMVNACRADDFNFFQPFISAGKLSVEQMHRAAQRYHLGKTRSGQPMFWMIDEMLEPQDAHIGSDNWVSALLKARAPILRHWRARHCLFGLHLLMEDGRSKKENVKSVCPKAICVVESEQSAVVLSELFPESIWMAYVSMTHLDLELFAPLQGCNVTIYPSTDPSFSAYPFFEELAAAVRDHYGIRITVSSILEDHASDDQKERCIDILGFIMENSA